MEAGKRMIISYLVKVLCREFAIYYRLAITTNNITHTLACSTSLLFRYNKTMLSTVQTRQADHFQFLSMPLQAVLCTMVFFSDGNFFKLSS